MKNAFLLLLSCVIAISTTDLSMAKPNEEQMAKIKAALPEKAPGKIKETSKVLIFSKTIGFTHSSIPFINEAITLMGEKTGAYTADITYDAADFTKKNLARYDAILMNNTTGELFDSPGVDKGLGPIGSEFVTTDGKPGWKGEYFNNSKFEQDPFVRVDDAVSFTWGSGSPDAKIKANDFSVRWTGILTAPETRTFTFNIKSDDGIQVTINDKHIFDHLKGSLKAEAKMDLKKGEKYNVTVKFREGGGEATCLLLWDYVSDKYIAAKKKETADRKQALLDFVKEGKGIIGIHAATDCFYKWPEYGELMGGYFTGHPWNEEVSIKIDDPKSPLVKALGGKNLVIADEIYQFNKGVYSRDKYRVLLSLDMENGTADKGQRKDKDFAISWVRSYGKGRVFYCSLGHRPEVIWTPVVLEHYLAGIQFALGNLKARTEPVPLVVK